MRRVMIIGQPGAGKSTLARALAAKTGLPVIHIDHIHWQAGWVERSAAEKTRLCVEAAAGEGWIFEGGHSATWEGRLARADTLIWIDAPSALRIWRVIRRTVFGHGGTRPDLPVGCVEGFHHETLPFWRFIWRTRKAARHKIQQFWDRVPDGKTRVHLRNKKQVAAFLRSGFPQ